MYNKKLYSRRRSKLVIQKDINVTPFVDVMLVLLIIFMVAAPLMKIGIKVNLPNSTSPNLSAKIEPITLSIKHDGSVFLQNTLITIKNLPIKLKTILNISPDRPVFIRGDKNVIYEKIINVINVLNKAGINKIALVTKNSPQ